MSRRGQGGILPQKSSVAPNAPTLSGPEQMENWKRGRYLTPATHPSPLGLQTPVCRWSTMNLDPSSTPRPTRGDRDPAPPGNPSWEEVLKPCGGGGGGISLARRSSQPQAGALRPLALPCGGELPGASSSWRTGAGACWSAESQRGGRSAGPTAAPLPPAAPAHRLRRAQALP